MQKLQRNQQPTGSKRTEEVPRRRVKTSRLYDQREHETVKRQTGIEVHSAVNGNSA